MKIKMLLEKEIFMSENMNECIVLVVNDLKKMMI